MDKKIRISIPVGERRYPLHVDPKDEPLFREGGRQINRRLNAYHTQFRSAQLEEQDMLAMTAIDLAFACQQQAQRVDTQDAEARIAGMVADLEAFLAEQ